VRSVGAGTARVGCHFDPVATMPRVAASRRDGALPVFDVEPGSRGKLPRPFLRRWRLAICHGTGIRRGSSVSGILLA
jgi:hypothetical protein